jgi:hypothetical protein
MRVKYHKNRSKLTLLATLPAGLTSVLVVPTAGTAQASVGISQRMEWDAKCYGMSCNGKDPYTMECYLDPEVRTIDEFTYSAYFELRYSPGCNAAWTRVTSPTTYNTIFGQIRAYQDYPTSLNAPATLVYGVQARAGTYWTNMVSSSYWERACTSSWFNATPTTCTAPH